MRADISKFFRSTTGRLTLTYTLIIIIMSVGFSVIFYHTSSQELGRQLLPHSFYGNFIQDRFRPDITKFLQKRIELGRHELLLRLIFINITVLIIGGLISYWLARRTLEPIEQSMEAQAQFVSDASHELKTPLTAIRASNEVALRKPSLKLSEAKKVIEQNTEDVGKLQSLTEGLLRLASNGKPPKLAPLNLQDAATEAINSILPLAQAKNISIDDKTSDLVVMVDQVSLHQVITSLLDNAIKYSQPKTTITLESELKGRYALLYIKDQGVGIKASDLPYIFRRFYRADQSRAKNQADGYGLGLAIAQKLIEEQHGEIIAASTPGKGSTFTIKLLNST